MMIGAQPDNDTLKVKEPSRSILQLSHIPSRVNIIPVRIIITIVWI